MTNIILAYYFQLIFGVCSIRWVLGKLWLLSRFIYQAEMWSGWRRTGNCQLKDRRNRHPWLRCQFQAATLDRSLLRPGVIVYNPFVYFLCNLFYSCLRWKLQEMMPSLCFVPFFPYHLHFRDTDSLLKARYGQIKVSVNRFNNFTSFLWGPW